MIFESIIFVLVYIVLNLVSIILSPLGLLVNTLMPSFNSSLQVISSFFNSLAPTLSYAVSWTMLSPQVIALVVSFYISTYGFILSTFLIRQVVTAVRQIIIKK